MRALFGSGEEAVSIDIEQANSWQRPFRVTIWREPKVDLHEMWERNRPW